MANIIKMDLYRLSKSTFAYVLLIVLAAFLVVNAKMQQYAFEQIKSNGSTESYQQMLEEDPDTYSDNLQEELEFAYGIKPYGFNAYFNGSVLNGDLLIFLSIFVAIFVNSQQKNGFIKSISQLAPKKGRFVISNAISVAIYTLILFVLTFAISLGSFRIFFGYLNISGFADYIGVYALKLLLLIAFSILILMFATVIKSTGLSMTLGILSAAGLFTLPIALIDFVLHKFLRVSENFSVNNYIITQNLVKLTSESDSSEMLRAGIVGIAFIAISMIISIVVMNKRDVK